MGLMLAESELFSRPHARAMLKKEKKFEIILLL